LVNLFLDTNNISTASVSSNKLNNFYKIAINQNQSQFLEAYQKIKEDCDKESYSVKWLDSIGDQITEAITPVLRPIVNSVQKLIPEKNFTEKGIRESGKGLPEIKADIFFNDKLWKIAKINDPKINQFKFIETQILSFANEKGIEAKSLEELSIKINTINKKAINGLELIGKGLKGIGKGIGGTALKSIPFLGIVTDLTLMCKNIYEAWQNGKKIILDLPLNKYEISYNEALLPTPMNTAKLSKQLDNLSLRYKDSPDDLSKILNIVQTLKAYGTDFVSTITNFLLTILDILEFTGLGLLISFIISIPIMAVEMANDTVVDESYGKSILLIKKICDQKILELNSNSRLESENISKDQKDFMRKFLERSSKPEGATNLAPSVEEKYSQSKLSRLFKLHNFMKVCY